MPPRRRKPEHVDPVEERRLMAGDEIGRLDQVGRMDRPLAEAQMRDRLRPRLVRVVDEIALREEPGSSAMIFTLFLLAPTVPSAPSP